MKNVFMVMVVAGFLASCGNNAADAEKNTKDSLDSIAKVGKNAVDSTAGKAKDSIEQKRDDQKQMVDSLHKGNDTTHTKM